VSLLTARQATEYLGRDRTSGRKALGYRRFLKLARDGMGPQRTEFDDGGPALYSTSALDAWVGRATR
jgi:hypothetical protein